jgi:hypothetical protein
VAGTILLLLSGDHPYPEARGLSPRSPRQRQPYRERAALRRVDDAALRKVLRKALDPDPARRYQSARDLWRALERLRQRASS